LVNRFTSVEYTYNNFFNSLLCYVLYSVRLEFMRQGIADWPSRVWRRVPITCTVALRIVKGDGKGTQCREYNWTTLFLGDILVYKGTWAPCWESLESETVKCDHESYETRTWEWMRWRGPAVIVNDKPILSSERTLHKDNDSRCSIEKNLAVSLKELGAKTNWLAVNRQS
jgi:hypothetical protein